MAADLFLSVAASLRVNALWRPQGCGFGNFGQQCLLLCSNLQELGVFLNGYLIGAAASTLLPGSVGNFV